MVDRLELTHPLCQAMYMLKPHCTMLYPFRSDGVWGGALDLHPTVHIKSVPLLNKSLKQEEQENT